MCFLAATLAKPVLAAMPWFKGAQAATSYATKPAGEEWGSKDAGKAALGMAVPVIGATQTDAGLLSWANDKAGG